MSIAGAKSVKLKAVAERDCPTCGQKAGQPCKTKRGGWYNPKYDVHAARMEQ